MSLKDVKDAQVIVDGSGQSVVSNQVGNGHYNAANKIVFDASYPCL